MSEWLMERGWVRIDDRVIVFLMALLFLWLFILWMKWDND